VDAAGLAVRSQVRRPGCGTADNRLQCSRWRAGCSHAHLTAMPPCICQAPCCLHVLTGLCCCCAARLPCLAAAPSTLPAAAPCTVRARIGGCPPPPPHHRANGMGAVHEQACTQPAACASSGTWKRSCARPSPARNPDGGGLHLSALQWLADGRPCGVSAHHHQREDGCHQRSATPLLSACPASAACWLGSACRPRACRQRHTRAGPCLLQVL
jgi:hypothetical protein